MLSLLSVVSRNFSDTELLEIAMHKANYGSGSNTGPMYSYNNALLSSANSSSGQPHESDETETDQLSTGTTVAACRALDFTSVQNSYNPNANGACIMIPTMTNNSSTPAAPPPLQSTSRSYVASSIRLGRR